MFINDPKSSFQLGPNYPKDLDQFKQAMKQGSTLFWSPRYQGHMNYDITTPHYDALVEASKYNQNNVAIESSGQTTIMELELIDSFKNLVGYGSNSWGYVCGGGTFGNIMGLWIARDRARANKNTDNIVLASKLVHYSVHKACKILGLNLHLCDIDINGRMILVNQPLSGVLCIVATIGTTEMGTCDNLREVVDLAHAHHVWVHADASYGGYFMYAHSLLKPENQRTFDSLKEADSVIIDMHKMGYAPYVGGIFMIKDGTNRKYVDCTTDVANYVDPHISSAWTLEGTRAGSLIASASFGHKIVAPSYAKLMSGVLEGANRLRYLLATIDLFNVIPCTDLGVVLFTINPPEMMSYFKQKFATDHRLNSKEGRITLVSTRLDASDFHPHAPFGKDITDVFRVVIMDPDFLSYVDQFIKTLLAEREMYIKLFDEFVCKRVHDLMEVAQECDTEKELTALVKSGKKFVAYNGFEPSGRMHIAQAFISVLNTNAIIANGGRMIIYIADWFAQLNHKMGGDLTKIKELGQYFIEIFKALGINTMDTEFVWASDFIPGNPNYWTRVLDISSSFTVARIHRCCQIMGRADKDALTESQHIYPCMQCADVFELGVDICQLGLDQRKVNMLAREYAEKKGLPSPIILSHHMLAGLKYHRKTTSSAPAAASSSVDSSVVSEDPEDALDPKAKMSKSIPDSAIYMDDSTEEIHRKIMNAFCDDDPKDNPIFEYLRYIILRWYGKLELCGTTYTDWETMYQDFPKMDKKIVKERVAELIDALIEPVRQHFRSSPTLSALLERVNSYRTTR